MPAHASQDAVPSEGRANGGPLTRRRFLTYVVAAPVLTVAASSAGDLIAPGRAHAVVPSPPQPENILDLGDVMVAATKQAQDLLVLEVTTDNRVVFRLPRAEVGQGVTTAGRPLFARCGTRCARLQPRPEPVSSLLQRSGGMCRHVT